jgi:large subunit ribosomal protein L5
VSQEKKPKKVKNPEKGKNPMREVRLGKLIINMGVGEAGPKLEKSEKLVSKITGMKPVRTKAKKRVPTWGLRPGLEIGLKCTLRGQKAVELLNRLLEGIEFKLSDSNFDYNGNVNFGIKEYITVPGIEYDPTVGIIGFNVNVCLERRGYRVRNRSINKSKIGKKHKVSKQDAMDFMKKEFKIEVVE